MKILDVLKNEIILTNPEFFDQDWKKSESFRSFLLSNEEFRQYHEEYEFFMESIKPFNSFFLTQNPERFNDATFEKRLNS